MNASLQIREATTQDCHHVAAIYNNYVGKATMDLKPKSGNYFESFLKTKSKQEVIYIAHLSDTIVGYSIIKKYSDREGYRFTAETSTYLAPEHLRKGYGKIIKKHVLDECKARGLKHIVAKIWSSNKSSIDFHESIGYSIVGNQQQIGFVDGQWQDVTIMQYIVD